MGERLQLINEAIALIGYRIGDVFLKSSVYETAAWGKSDQPGFLNIAVGVETEHAAIEVLKIALEIEHELGRIRMEKWGQRLIDIDLIFYGDEVINIPGILQIPHPEMHNRRFVLVPMVEIAGSYLHPLKNAKISDILQNLTDNLSVLKINV